MYDADGIQLIIWNPNNVGTDMVGKQNSSRAMRSKVRLRFSLKTTFLPLIVIGFVLSTKPCISVSRHVVEVGPVHAEEVYHTKFLVRNTGWLSLQVIPDAYSCGSAFDEFEPFELKSGENREIPVAFHLYKLQRLGVFWKEFRIKSNDPLHRSTVLRVIGTALEPIDAGLRTGANSGLTTEGYCLASPQ